MANVSQDKIFEALATVDDPEIGRPITELGMVDEVTVEGGSVAVRILLTIAGCPMKTALTEATRAAVAAVDGVDAVEVTCGVMTDEQRRQLRSQLKGGGEELPNPFNDPNSRTRVYAVASGKGGVGKSSVTVNLAAALAARGLSVGIVDADIYGHSVPHMLGSDDRPTPVDDMIMPPQAHGVKMISIAHFTEGNAPVVWRGPMLHRAISQFLTDVFWGDVDVLLLDLPPGTGDIAISVAQLLPQAELLIVTTPQAAAAEVAERAGSITQQTRQKIAGVIENMAAMVMPDGSVVDVFGSGGGQIVADRLSVITGTQVNLLGSIPLDPQVRIGGDDGTPIAIGQPDSPAGKAFGAIAEKLARRQDSLAGMPLGVTPRR
ncbi:Mrp/NBP35 family ATP-binding protein [Corynebacterium aquilae]|uniref:Iron-sulfur cluster carrier protein n=1 Tax=Corynebacterium aquilae DSM 44791 TaxID=1431546 RepID=A0A1L7CF90_9CORY|nr:Mrp/NBP35 family ATP-binding protein [Corynebacterium aquilae]APT84494.1 sodium:proton antiporter [Corynebacterium aquilae DSM 44791]